MRYRSLSFVRVRARAALLLCSLALLSLTGCDSGETVVVLSIRGLTTDVSQMAIVVKLNGGVVKTTRLSPPVAQVGLRLESGSHGLLEVGVGGGNLSGCLVSLGVSETEIHAEPEVQLSVMLEYQPTPDCG